LISATFPFPSVLSEHWPRVSGIGWMLLGDLAGRNGAALRAVGHMFGKSEVYEYRNHP
jgi:hypothetical protein